jgi:hypothetical protein
MSVSQDIFLFLSSSTLKILTLASHPFISVPGLLQFYPYILALFFMYLVMSLNVSATYDDVILCLWIRWNVLSYRPFLPQTCPARRCLFLPACFYAFRSLQQLQPAAPPFTIYVQAMSRTFMGRDTKLKQQLYVAM